MREKSYIADFIDENYIFSCIEKAKNTSWEKIQQIIEKAESCKGLKHEEAAALLMTSDENAWEKIFKAAKKIKDYIYGDRIVIFAPLYISDYCVNECEYCGYKHSNVFNRRKLTMEEIKNEVAILEKMGHKRLALEAGEDPLNCSMEYVLEAIDTIYKMKTDTGEIRRINVNIASTTVENYKKLKDIGIGTYILFQETYKRDVYETVHKKGPKHDYDYHTTAFTRAMEAGVDDVGGGVLFGLYEPIFEVIGLMLHNEYLENNFGAGFHTISMPRICSADGVARENYKYTLSDDMFKKIVAVIRLAVPFTGIIISTRETEAMRKELIQIGVSQISAGSTVEVGGYNAKENQGTQFKVADERPAQDIIYSLMEDGKIPSFCTACYRQGRTGDRFMELAKSGEIKNVCLPNALFTLKEYSLDYGSGQFKEKTKEIIENNIGKIENTEVRKITEKNLKLLENGIRDVYL